MDATTLVAYMQKSRRAVGIVLLALPATFAVAGSTSSISAQEAS
jgi:hypothetical protein